MGICEIDTIGGRRGAAIAGRYGRFSETTDSRRAQVFQRKSQRLCRLLIASFALAFTFTLVACEEKGPAEEAGEKLDEGSKEMGDALEDATGG
jgi:hypothetical protein